MYGPISGRLSFILSKVFALLNDSTAVYIANVPPSNKPEGTLLPGQIPFSFMTFSFSYLNIF